jgi:hypothetical protein
MKEQQSPDVSIEPTADKKWLKLKERVPTSQHNGHYSEHQGFITFAEARAVHDYIANDCTTDCLCYQRGLETQRVAVGRE